LAIGLSEDEFKSWGWRIPFIFSAALVLVGLYVRLKLHESPVFMASIKQNVQIKVPLVDVFSKHGKRVLQGSLAMVVCYALFYISTVFSLSYGVSHLHFAKADFLKLLCLAVVFMGCATPLSAWLSDKWGRRPVLMLGTFLAVLSGFTVEPLLGGGSTYSVALFLIIELFLMGFTFGPMGALLPEIFPTSLRYTGAAISYNIGGIIGASVAPFIAQILVERGGLSWVGYYVSIAALLSFIAVFSMSETRDVDLDFNQADRNTE